MKVHKLTVMVIDFDDLGDADVAAELERGRFPNRCISPRVARVESCDIGEWDERSPLNQERRDAWSSAFAKLFPVEPPK